MIGVMVHVFGAAFTTIRIGLTVSRPNLQNFDLKPFLSCVSGIISRLRVRGGNQNQVGGQLPFRRGNEGQTVLLPRCTFKRALRTCRQMPCNVRGTRNDLFDFLPESPRIQEVIPRNSSFFNDAASAPLRRQSPSCAPLPSSSARKRWLAHSVRCPLFFYQFVFLGGSPDDIKVSPPAQSGEASL